MENTAEPTRAVAPTYQTQIEQAQENAAPAAKIGLDQLINLCMEKEASDIHFREGGRPALRVGGKIIFIENIEALSKEETEAMMLALQISEEEKKILAENKEIDFSYTHKNGVNFRVNLFYQKSRLAGVMRMISKNIPKLEELGIPDAVKSHLEQREGLVIITGTAGAGKSTTIHSMLDYINDTFVQHILTIENPIEYLFEDKKSMITQREVGKDASDTVSALSAVMREDANVVMVNNVENYQTFDQILNLVETGHLVIISMLTKDITQAIERILNFYPQALRQQAQDRIAENLKLAMAQDLAERQDESGMIAVFELMLMNESIRNVIRHGNLVQLRTAIQTGVSEGMITMDQYAYQLAQQGIIAQDQAERFTQKEG